MSYAYDMMQADLGANSASGAHGFREAIAEEKRKDDLAKENIARLLASSNTQLALLQAQLDEVQKTNASLEKQASSSAKSAKFSQWIAVVSAVIALASFIVALLK